MIGISNVTSRIGHKRINENQRQTGRWNAATRRPLTARKIRTVGRFSRIVARVERILISHQQPESEKSSTCVAGCREFSVGYGNCRVGLVSRPGSPQGRDRRAEKDFYTPAGNSWDKLDRNSSAWNILSISPGDTSVACHGSRHFIARLHAPVRKRTPAGENVSSEFRGMESLSIFACSSPFPLLYLASVPLVFPSVRTTCLFCRCTERTSSVWHHGKMLLLFVPIDWNASHPSRTKASEGFMKSLYRNFSFFASDSPSL